MSKSNNDSYTKHRIRVLLDVYHTLPKKSNGEGRRIRRRLGRLGYRLSEQ